jgi:hypothetical protein
VGHEFHALRKAGADQIIPDPFLEAYAALREAFDRIHAPLIYWTYDTSSYCKNSLEIFIPDDIFTSERCYDMLVVCKVDS